MLRDSPSCEVMQAQWAEVERAKASGLTRAVGVVNYCRTSLDCILRTAKEPPAINYFMLHGSRASSSCAVSPLASSTGPRRRRG